MQSFISSITKKYKNPKMEYDGKRFDVYSIDESYDGKVISRELVSHPGAVVILPFLDEETILLIKNYRFSMQTTLLELPAGTLEPAEEVETCAYRELEEETGYRAKKMAPLLHFFPSPGFCNEILYAYVASDLTQVGQDLDETEKIEVVPTPFKKALEMIHTGEICDAKTITTLLFYKQFMDSI
jgi:ADP-ribose pyrophosphatase